MDEIERREFIESIAISGLFTIEKDGDDDFSDDIFELEDGGPSSLVVDDQASRSEYEPEQNRLFLARDSENRGKISIGDGDEWVAVDSTGPDGGFKTVEAEREHITNESQVGINQGEGHANINRRDPVPKSDKTLVSRDYRSRSGVELITSVPVAPDADINQTDTGIVDHFAWEVPVSAYTGVPDYGIMYATISGYVHNDTDGETISLILRGEAPTINVTFDNNTAQQFMLPFAELTDYRDGDGQARKNITFQATVSGGTGIIRQGATFNVFGER